MNYKIKYDEQANLRQGCRKPKTKRKSIKTGTTTCYPFWKEVNVLKSK